MERELIEIPPIHLAWSDWIPWNDLVIDSRSGEGVAVPNGVPGVHEVRCKGSEERLTQHFERVPVELGKLVEEEHAVVHETDLARMLENGKIAQIAARLIGVQATLGPVPRRPRPCPPPGPCARSEVATPRAPLASRAAARRFRPP